MNTGQYTQDEWIRELFGGAKMAQPIDIDSRTSFSDIETNMVMEANRFSEPVYLIAGRVLPASFPLKHEAKIDKVVWPTNWQYKPNYERLTWLLND